MRSRSLIGFAAVCTLAAGLRRAEGRSHRARRRRRSCRLAGALRHPARRPAWQRQDPGAGDSRQRRDPHRHLDRVPADGLRGGAWRLAQRPEARSTPRSQPIVNMQKLQRFMDSVSKTFKVDSGSEAAYNQAAGGLLAARHILIGFKNPAVPASTAEKDSLRKKADDGSRPGDAGQLHRRWPRSTAPIRARRRTPATSASSRQRRDDPGVLRGDGRAQARRDLAADRDELRLSHHSAPAPTPTRRDDFAAQYSAVGQARRRQHVHGAARVELERAGEGQRAGGDQGRGEGAGQAPQGQRRRSPRSRAAS